MVKLLFLRHGLSVTNKLGCFCGQLDAPLDEEGYVQAEQAAEYICANYKIDAIYSSDLVRVKQTVAPTAKKLNLPVTYTKYIREVDVGSWLGCTFDEIKEKEQEKFARYSSGDTSVVLGDGESFNDVLFRAEKEITRIASENDGKTVLIGTHGGVIRMLCGKWLNLSDVEMRVKYPTNNAALTVVDFENGVGKIVEYGIDNYLSNPTVDFSVKDFVDNLKNNK